MPPHTPPSTPPPESDLSTSAAQKVATTDPEGDPDNGSNTTQHPGPSRNWITAVIQPDGTKIIYKIRMDNPIAQGIWRRFGMSEEGRKFILENWTHYSVVDPVAGRLLDQGTRQLFSQKRCLQTVNV